MARYFFNENPQVEMWKEKAFKTKSLFDQYKQVAEKYNESIVNALHDLTDEVRQFNSLPWYRKVFYKFKL